MIKSLKKYNLMVGAAMMAGVLAEPSDAHANNFNTIAGNIIASIDDMPGLLSGLAYMFGLLLGVLGILKIKDHVENPAQTPLKDGAIRLAAGGGLFALPIVFQAMTETVDQGGAGAAPTTPTLNAVNFATG